MTLDIAPPGPGPSIFRRTGHEGLTRPSELVKSVPPAWPLFLGARKNGWLLLMRLTDIPWSRASASWSTSVGQ